MTFFNEAIEDGTIDKKISMNQKEFEMMLRGMLEDSNAWHLHKNKHKDAHIAPIFREEEFSEFEQAVDRNSNKSNKSKSEHDSEESHIIQYDMHDKKFMAGCQCGAKFKIDVKNDNVEPADDSIKMKELSQYDKNRNENSYGRESSEGGLNYDNKPARVSAIESVYNSNNKGGMKYKN